MEGAEIKVQSIPKNTKIFQGVKKAVIQLNIWVTSIDLSYRNALLSKNADGKETAFREIFDKMNTHYGRMTRIVEICQDLSRKNKVKEMELINEFISYVIDRFKTLHNQVELTFKKTSIENISGKCEAIFMKINECNKNIQSLSNLVVKAKNVSERQNQVQRLKVLFYQYSEDIEQIKAKVPSLADKSFEEFVTNMKEANDSLFLIKTTIDQQWSLIIQICKPFRNKKNPFVKVFDEPLDSSEPMGELCLHVVVISCDPSVEMPTSDKQVKYRTVMPKRLLQIAHRNATTSVYQICDISFWTVELYFSAESHFKANPVCVLTSCYSDTLPDNLYIHLNCETKTTLSPKFHQPDVSLQHRIFQMKSQPPSRRCLISQSHFTSLMSKFPPNQIFLKYLYSTIEIIKGFPLNTNDKLYENHVKFEFSRFENHYEFLSENNSLEFLLTSTLDEMVEAGERRSNRVADNLMWNAILLARKVVNKFSNMNFLLEIFPIEISTRKGMLEWLANFMRRNIRFDLSLACLILVKEAMSYFCNKFHLKELISSALEINQYQSLSTTI